MKNYRNLLPVVLIVLMVLSFYKLNSDASQAKNQYDGYVAEARKWAEKGVTANAMDYYRAAIELNPSIELYLEVAEYYRNLGDENAWVNWCEDIYVQFPTDVKAYDCVLEAYLTEKDYVACYDVLYMAQRRNLSSEYMSSVLGEIAYYYNIDPNVYKEVGVFCCGYSAVQGGGLWGYVDVYGNRVVNCQFAQAGLFSVNSSAPVVNAEGEAYFINTRGTKIQGTAEGYQHLGIDVGGILAAQREDGKYVYLDEDYQVLFDEYDYASAVNAGIGAVKVGEQWSIIDSSGNVTSASQYSDIKLDEREMAYRNDRLFVKSGNSYIMVDVSGTQIGSMSFEDAHVFNDGTYAAVKMNGSWCFIDKDGNLRSEKTYQDARSFSNGLAAVKINDKWGFVDLNEELRIPAEFQETKDFNDKGSCFVKDGEDWKLLRLYRLNREG